MEVEFKLFGSLTIKQFGYLAAGLLVAVMLALSGLPFLLKFPFVIGSIIMGGFLSLVRINGQASSVWVSNFVVAMFTPQERVWKRSAVVPDVLQEGQSINQVRNVEMIHKVRGGESFKPKAKRYTSEPTQKSELDDFEDERLKQIQMSFETSQTDNGASVESNDKMVDASIKGFVVDKTGKAIANALISINNGNGEFIAEAVSDNQGLFSVRKRLEIGSYIITINSEGSEFDYYRIQVSKEALPTYKFAAK